MRRCPGVYAGRAESELQQIQQIYIQNVQIQQSILAELKGIRANTGAAVTASRKESRSDSDGLADTDR